MVSIVITYNRGIAVLSYIFWEPYFPDGELSLYKVGTFFDKLSTFLQILIETITSKHFSLVISWSICFWAWVSRSKKTVLNFLVNSPCQTLLPLRSVSLLNELVWLMHSKNLTFTLVPNYSIPYIPLTNKIINIYVNTFTYHQ